MRTLENGWGQIERRRRAALEVRELVARAYRAFVAWGSLYDEADEWEEGERRGRVFALVEELSNGYAPRSLWLDGATRKKVEELIRKSDELCSRFSADVDENGYERSRTGITRCLSKELSPLKKGAETALEEALSGPRPSRWRRVVLRAQSGEG